MKTSYMEIGCEGRNRMEQAGGCVQQVALMLEVFEFCNHTFHFI